MASADDVRLFVSRTGVSESVAQERIRAAGGDVLKALQQYRSGAPSSSARRSGAGNVRGLGDYAGDDDDSDPEHNEYYAGGEKSGQVVRGAPGPDRVEALFEAARAAGAREGTAQDLAPSFEPRAFQGRARTLQGTVVEDEGAGPSRSAEPEPLVINFYRNGYFQVGDGPGRSIADPANSEFMQAIMSGRLPPELEPANPSTPVNVNLVRKDEDWDERAAPKVMAFRGSGNRLGGEASSTASLAAPSAPSSSSTWTGPDESKPLTSLQLRLADGSRLVAKFNLTQTVADIRAFLRTARPDLPVTFRLATAFPAQPLEDDSATIEAAGLANAVIIQKA